MLRILPAPHFYVSHQWSPCGSLVKKQFQPATPVYFFRINWWPRIFDDLHHVKSRHMRAITLTTSKIVDAESFHSIFAYAMGFPNFYGRNMDAWIDCMSSLTDKEPLARIRLGTSDTLLIVLPDFEALSARIPTVVRDLWECTAFVNRRYASAGEAARVALVPE